MPKELVKPKKLFADEKMNRIDMEDVTVDKSGKQTGKRKLSDSEIKNRVGSEKKSKGSGMRTIPIDGGTMTMPKDEPYGLERPVNMKKGGAVKSSASKRADGCCIKGKTRGKMV